MNKEVNNYEKGSFDLIMFDHIAAIFESAHDNS
jgi:hypothetical protein